MKKRVRKSKKPHISIALLWGREQCALLGNCTAILVRKQKVKSKDITPMNYVRPEIDIFPMQIGG